LTTFLALILVDDVRAARADRCPRGQWPPFPVQRTREMRRRRDRQWREGPGGNSCPENERWCCPLGVKCHGVDTDSGQSWV
ncbi:hypothetical protein BaRGS_00025433, partial [Batillaria attramentaria]